MLVDSIGETLTPIDRQQQGLQSLSQHPAVYGGDLAAAAAAITHATAHMLAVDRVSLWLYTDNRQSFEQIDSYNRIDNVHTKGRIDGDRQSR